MICSRLAYWYSVLDLCPSDLRYFLACFAAMWTYFEVVGALFYLESFPSHESEEKEAMQERENPGGERERAISLQLKLASRVKTTFLPLLAPIFGPPRRALKKADICIYFIRFYDCHDRLYTQRKVQHTPTPSHTPPISEPKCLYRLTYRNRSTCF